MVDATLHVLVKHSIILSVVNLPQLTRSVYYRYQFATPAGNSVAWV